MQELGLIKYSTEKNLTIWRPVLPIFPRAPIASFLFSTLSSFQRVLKVSGFDCMTAAAYDLILVNPCKSEGDGKCPWQVPTCSWQALKYNIKRKMWRCKCGRLLQLSNIIKAMIFGIWGNYQSMKVSGELPIFAVNLQFHCRFSVV